MMLIVIKEQSKPITVKSELIVETEPMVKSEPNTDPAALALKEKLFSDVLTSVCIVFIT